jgi:hypothetical protein
VIFLLLFSSPLALTESLNHICEGARGNVDVRVLKYKGLTLYQATSVAKYSCIHTTVGIVHAQNKADIVYNSAYKAIPEVDYLSFCVGR